MKNTIIISILTLSLIISCSEDFTDLAPISDRNVVNFYQTAGDFEVAVNGIYGALQERGCYNESYWIMQELRSDNTFWAASGLAEIIVVLDDFEEFADNEIALRAWNDSYLGISRANIVLSRIGDIDMDASLKNQFIGEALFLRSLFYYHLAVSFENIPLVLTETQSVEEGTEHVQVPSATIYNQLLIDLADAENRLPTSYSGSDVGRATKGAAATLLAKIQLTVGDNSAAASTLRGVMNLGYSLLPNYADLWGVENEHNAESIFEVEFQGGLGTEGNLFTNQFSAPLGQGVVSGFRNQPEPDLLAAYEPGDLRFSASIDTFYIDNGGEAHSITIDGQSWTIKYGTENPFNDEDGPNNFVVFRYADVLLMLAEALGESDEAYGLINQVRNRAGLGPIDASTPGSFAEKLLQERRVELAFENHRWADLRRFGVAQSYLQNTESKFRELFLIPQRELDLNPNFSQN